MCLIKYPNRCPVCKASLVIPSGPPDAPGLVIGEFPGKDELRYLEPFVGSTRGVMVSAFRDYGMDFGELRKTNVWLHAPGYEGCLNWCVEQAIKEAKRRRVVLLVGSLAVQTFSAFHVMEVSGLQIKSILPTEIVMASPNPAMVFHTPQGEFLLAIEKFSKRYKRATGGR